MEGGNINPNEIAQNENLKTPETGPKTREERMRQAEIVVKSMFDARGDAVSVIRENPTVNDKAERNAE